MKKGFTLVEILTVIALLGIVILIAVPNVMKLRETALQKEAEQLRRSIETAAVLYAIDKKSSKSITVQKLLDNGYIEANKKNGEGNCNKTSGCIVNPKTGSIWNDNSISITIIGTQKTASCSGCTN